MTAMARSGFLDPRRLDRRAALASVSVAAILIVAKLATWLITGSVAILSSLVDSCIDALASLVTLVSVHHAARPADPAHRYGHGKAEPMAALLIAAFLAGSALVVAVEAVARLLVRPQPVAFGELGIAVMLGAIVLTGGLVLFQRYVVRRTGSIAIGADQVHYLTDLATNLVVIAALALTLATGWPYFDPLFACAIVAMLLWGAAGIGRRAIDMLMDRELPEAERARILHLARDHPHTQGVHDLRTRRAGRDVFIELHLELDPNLPLARAHDITHEVEDAIRRAFPSADVLLHQEPAGLDDERRDALIAAAERWPAPATPPRAAPPSARDGEGSGR
jgi:ferrous-iron efflux pump FieF